MSGVDTHIVDDTHHNHHHHCHRSSTMNVNIIEGERGREEEEKRGRGFAESRVEYNAWNTANTHVNTSGKFPCHDLRDDTLMRMEGWEGGGKEREVTQGSDSFFNRAHDFKKTSSIRAVDPFSFREMNLIRCSRYIVRIVKAVYRY